MEPDNTLAQTLGGLGANLQQAFDPMRQIQAGNILSEVQQRQWELQQKQRIDAANQNAAEVYGNANPHGQSPADLEVSKAQIRSGNFNLAPTIDALVAAGNLQARQKASALYASTHSDLPPADLASAQADLVSGRKNASEIDSDRANAKSTINKTQSVIDETNAAVTPAAKAAAASGQPEVATQLDAADTLFHKPPITGPLEDPKVQANIDQTNILRGQAKIPVTADMPVSSGLAAPQATAKIVQGNLADQSKFHAPDLVRSAIPPTDPITGLPIAPNTPGGFTQTAAGPDTAATISTEAAKTQAHEIAAGDVKTLDEAIGESGSAQAMKSKLSQLKDLADALDTSGAGLTSRALRTLADYNVHPGDIGATYAAIQQIINAEIPDVRQKAGIQRLAGPAIKEEQLILGTANMPKKTLMNIIANEEAAADLQISRATLAYQARTGQLPMNEYYKQSLALDATIKQHTDELRKQYKAVGTEAQQPAQTELPQAPPLTGGTVMDAIRALVGAQSTPAVSAPAATQEPQVRWDPRTKSVVPVQ